MNRTTVGLLAMLVLMALAGLLFVAAYLLSVYQTYQANGFGWQVVLIAIPVLGQIIYAAATLKMAGLFNSFNYLFFGAFALFGLAQLIAHAFTPKEEG